MKKILGVCLCTWCAIGIAQTTEALLNADKNTDNVTTQGMGYDLKNHSSLKQKIRQASHFRPSRLGEGPKPLPYIARRAMAST